jgi:hypothetical protein
MPARSLVNAQAHSTWEQPASAGVSPAQSESPFASTPNARRWGWCAVLLLVVFGAFARVRTALADPNFDSVHPEGMLKSEEEHLDWLETQLGLIAKLGDKTYLAEQLRK